MKPAGSSSPSLGRMTFDKTWEGDLKGKSVGEMLSVGEPARGTAAYTVMEVFTGTLGGRQGRFAFHQYGVMIAGEPILRYEIVPGSGSGELMGMTGELNLQVIDDVHHYDVTYQVPNLGNLP